MTDLRKEEHFQRLGETSRQVWDLLESSIQDRIHFGGLQNLIPDFEVMLRRKRQGNFLRPYLSRLFLEVSGDAEWTNSRNLLLLAAIEAYNISTYHANTAIDGKFQAADRQSSPNQLICAMQMLGLSHDLIRKSLEDNNQAAEAMRFLMVTNDAAYTALNIDLNILSATSPSALNLDQEKYHELYTERCRGICGITFQLALLPLIASGCPQQVYNALSLIACHLGLGIQAVNDLEDLASRNVLGNDSYIDLRNGRLTLPYYLLHCRGYSRDRLLDITTSTTGGPILLSTVARHTGVVDEVKSYIRFMAWNPIRQQLRFLSRVNKSNTLRYFQFIHHLLFGSRIWNEFKIDTA